MTIPQRIIKKMRNLQIVSNKTRFLILIALYNSHVLKYGDSQTFSELRSVLGISNSDLSYHLKLLEGTDVIKKSNEKHYHISKEGINLMKIVVVEEKTIKEIAKSMRLT